MSSSLSISSIVRALAIPIFRAAAFASSIVFAAIAVTNPPAARIARTCTSPIKPKPITPAFITNCGVNVISSRENVVVILFLFR